MERDEVIGILKTIENSKNLERIKSIKRYAFRGQDLSGLDLRNKNLEDFNFEKTNFAGAKLRGTIFKNTDLESTNFTGADLREAIFLSTLLFFTKFKNTDLRNASFAKTNLMGIDLAGINLTGVDFSGANLKRTNLRGAILTGANLTDLLTVEEANLIGTNWWDAKKWCDKTNIFIPLTKDDVQGAILTKEDRKDEGITVDNVDVKFPAEEMKGWKSYQKKTKTVAIRVNRPFTVQTLEGELYCGDGYLALDNKNNPYPIDKEIFECTYEEVKEEMNYENTDNT